MQYVIVAEHAPELCPNANAAIRKMLHESASGIPALAEKLDLKIITLNVFGPDHVIMAVVEGGPIENVREFIVQSRLIQWNRTRVHATWSLEEAMAKADELPTLF